MAELKDALGPYVLEKALAADRSSDNCFVLDVGRDENGDIISSLEHVVDQVDDYLINVYDRLAPVTKLYVVGEWNATRAETSDKTIDSSEEQEHYANEVSIISYQRDKCILKVSGLLVVTILAESSKSRT
jgi:hypothetical protein